MADPLAPWLQLLIQGGALAVLIVLATRVPVLLAALKDWRKETEETYKEERKQIRDDNKEALALILAHCDETAKRRDQDVQGLQRELENLQEQIEALTGRRKPRPLDPK